MSKGPLPHAKSGASPRDPSPGWVRGPAPSAEGTFSLQPKGFQQEARGGSLGEWWGWALRFPRQVGLGAGMRRGKWTGPEKQSPGLSGRLWTMTLQLPVWGFAGSQISSGPAGGPGSVVCEEVRKVHFQGGKGASHGQVGSLRHGSETHVCASHALGVALLAAAAHMCPFLPAFRSCICRAPTLPPSLSWAVELRG